MIKLIYIRCRKKSLSTTNMFIGSFIGYLKAEKNYSEHTLRAYANDLRAFQDYLSRIDGSLSFSNADEDVVRSWIASLVDDGAAPSSVCRRLSALRSFYSFLCREGVTDKAPVAGVRGPKRRRRLPSVVCEKDMDSLIDGRFFAEGYEGCRDRMVLMCFYETGIRLSELVGLDVVDVDLSSSCLKVFGKRSRERLVPFADGLKGEFLHYLEQREAFCGSSSGALFLSSRGGRISRSSVYRMVRNYLSSVTTLEKRSPHVLRHTFATAMLNNSAEIGAVKELLGHKRLATTEIYTHLTFEELKRFYDKAHPRAGTN